MCLFEKSSATSDLSSPRYSTPVSDSFCWPLFKYNCGGKTVKQNNPPLVGLVILIVQHERAASVSHKATSSQTNNHLTSLISHQTDTRTHFLPLKVTISPLNKFNWILINYSQLQFDYNLCRRSDNEDLLSLSEAFLQIFELECVSSCVSHRLQ